MGLRTAVKFTAVALVLLFACVSVGYLGFERAFAVTHPAGGPYYLLLTCNNHTVTSTSTFTYDGGPLTPTVSLSCGPGGYDLKRWPNYTHPWNDLDIAYVVDGGAPTTLKIPSTDPHPVLGKAYVLQSPSPGGTVTPTPNDPPGDATITVSSGGAVGGIADLPDVAGSSGPPYALLAGALAAVLALMVGTLYARRRLS